jgi:hypothetical protein
MKISIRMWLALPPARKRGEPPHAEILHRGEWVPTNVVLGKAGRRAMGWRQPNRG